MLKIKLSAKTLQKMAVTPKIFTPSHEGWVLTRIRRSQELARIRDHETLYREFGLWVYPNGDLYGSGVQNYPNGIFHPAPEDEAAWGHVQRWMVEGRLHFTDAEMCLAEKKQTEAKPAPKVKPIPFREFTLDIPAPRK